MQNEAKRVVNRFGAKRGLSNMNNNKNKLGNTISHLLTSRTKELFLYGFYIYFSFFSFCSLYL